MRQEGETAFFVYYCVKRDLRVRNKLLILNMSFQELDNHFKYEDDK